MQIELKIRGSLRTVTLFHLEWQVKEKDYLPPSQAKAKAQKQGIIKQWEPPGEGNKPAFLIQRVA